MTEDWQVFTKLAESINRLDMGTPFIITKDLEALPVYDLVPDVYHDDEEDIIVESDEWEGCIKSATRQYGYSGHVMHPSEFIGRGLAMDLYMWNDEGTVFSVVCVDVIDSDQAAGWTIIRKKG